MKNKPALIGVGSMSLLPEKLCPSVLTVPDVNPLTDDVVDMIAKEIGKTVASHIETMYPEAAKAVAWKSAALSIEGVVRNAVSAAGKAAEAGHIEKWLEHSKAMRKLDTKMRQAVAGNDTHEAHTERQMTKRLRLYSVASMLLLAALLFLIGMNPKHLRTDEAPLRLGPNPKFRRIAPATTPLSDYVRPSLDAVDYYE